MQTGNNDIAKKLDAVIEWLRVYKTETQCTGVVLGLSGGKDSTVVAMLAKKVWGDNVFAVLMPNGEQSDISDSINIAKTLGLRHAVVNIGKSYSELVSAVKETAAEISAQAKTNIPPRLRMTTLYAIAQSLGYRVIGTGNASEAYIGWTTKWGDSAYDFNPIAGLTCTQVIAAGKILAAEFGLSERYIVKTPSDGLTGKSDEENFGFSYAELDAYIAGSGETVRPEIAKKIESMHAASTHKRTLPPSPVSCD